MRRRQQRHRRRGDAGIGRALDGVAEICGARVRELQRGEKKYGIKKVLYIEKKKNSRLRKKKIFNPRAFVIGGAFHSVSLTLYIRKTKGPLVKAAHPNDARRRMAPRFISTANAPCPAPNVNTRTWCGDRERRNARSGSSPRPVTEDTTKTGAIAPDAAAPTAVATFKKYRDRQR